MGNKYFSPKKFKTGDFLKDTNGNVFICDFIGILPLSYLGNAFAVLFQDGTCSINEWMFSDILIDYASEEEKQKLLQAIDAQGFAWDSELLKLTRKTKI